MELELISFVDELDVGGVGKRINNKIFRFLGRGYYNVLVKIIGFGVRLFEF